MKLVLPALLALSFVGQFASAQFSEGFEQRQAARLNQHAQMMSVWQEQSCVNTITAVAAQQKEQIVSSQVTHGQSGDAKVYVTAKISNGAECSCAVAIGEEPTVSCE
jgi:hypothetical protein